jgi:chromosome segregation protein
VKINRLRLLGFKSFVEPADLVIEPGLTGVVGPNGCGKSNLLEALRWVMGETSHKSMRAAAMDDVIFAGTVNRPQRNSAEVTIFIDNSERQAPAEFNDRDIIEITRRIEREAGSAYRINGKEARARDVKILFEDAATGARSPALVRQGQIGEIVNAKPESRRRILEDAAGIAGLHSRRHEAELRLKAAEANLARLTDVLGGLNSQVEGLKRQARQARRYKEISNEIRKTEALHLHLSWAEAQAAVEREEQSLNDALAAVAFAVEAEARAVTVEAELAERVPPLREEESKKGAILGRFRIESENFEREAARQAARVKELEARAQHLEADLQRERAIIAEAQEIIGQLDAEIEQLTAADADAETREAEARKAAEAAEADLRSAEARLSELTRRAAEFQAKRRSLETSERERREQIARIERQLATLAAQETEAMARAPDARKLAETSETGQHLAAQVSDLEEQTLEAEDIVRERATVAKERREAAQQARMALNALRIERETLQKLLISPQSSDYPAVVDQIRVAAGFEAALGAALGDDLEAPAHESAPIHWRQLDAPPDDAALPAGAEPLILNVEAPPELVRRLRQIGVVAREDGARLQPYLRPGQRLVSREGDLWRWDGFVAAADGTTAAAQRLAERNRLADIERRELEAEDAAQALVEAEEQAASALAKAETEQQRLRQLWRETQSRLASTREALTQIERAARDTEARLASIAEARATAEQDLGEHQARHAEISAAISEIADYVDLDGDLEAAKDETETKRRHVLDTRAALASLESDRRVRADRLSAARLEHERWTTRSASAVPQVANLEARLEEARNELETLDDLPAQIEAQRQKLLTAISEAERERQTAADALAEVETALRAASQALRAAQSAVAADREGKARAETRLEGARARRQEEARRIRETLNVNPDGCLAVADIKPGTELPSLADTDHKLSRLKADRERLGGVNLQADDELVTLGERLSGMEAEKADVEQAIAKLRGAIGQLNREAKQRLNSAFETVNGHFQRLFTTLFNGGEARLEMVESVEDPLEGGLEIIAKPPGKKPATLSLLSGGEQTLTALSLIFAVFLTNPSPICVLDEVDAPLDDANVDRFCRLMEHMAADTATRFLVITHHPMTMTRMNRLFGVTMAEKGISQLVSVDLETAQRFREAG